MKWNELKELVIAEYDRRNLKSNVRYRALDKVDAFIKEKRPEMMSDVHASFPSDKDTLNPNRSLENRAFILREIRHDYGNN